MLLLPPFQKRCDWPHQAKCTTASGTVPATTARPRPTTQPTTQYFTYSTTRRTTTHRPTVQTPRLTVAPAQVESTGALDVHRPSGTSSTVDTGYKVSVKTLLLFCSFLELP